MPGNQITFGIGFNVNESNLNSLKQSLKEIQQLTSKDLVNIGKASSIQEANAQLQQIKKSASEVQSALTRAFNTDLGTVNVARFNQELKAMNIGKIAADFNNAGAAGQSAFLAITSQAMSTNTQLKQSYNWLSQIGTTLANTVKWNIASTAVNAFSNSISSAFNYVKVLDASLTDIRIVTGQSREEMAQFAVEANRAAQSLGRQTKEYTNAALAFYQQGLSDQEVRVRTEASLKAQNITGAGTEIVDQLTAVWNGFQATIDQTESYVDKLAAVADSSASNLSELATGMSKVASVANNVGVDIDSLTAQLATIIATTRQAPETVGNALKTIYARINDIKTGSDEAEISLGNYTGKMAELGFSVLDADGRLKDTGDTITEIGERWATLSREQQIYLAQTMAGQRQMNNLISLFDNWEKYSEMLNVSLGAQGTLNEKNARYMDSLAAHINSFRTAVEGMQDALINEDTIMGVYDAGTKLVNVVQNIITGMGGMRWMLLGLGALGATVFKDQIANSITTAINNVNVYRQNLEETKNLQETLQLFDVSVSQYQAGELAPNFEAAIQGVRQLREEFASYGDVASQAQKEALNGLLQSKAEISSEVLAFDELTTSATEFGNAIARLRTSRGDVQGFFDKDSIFSSDIASGNITLLKGATEEIQRLIENTRYGKEEIVELLESLSNTQTAITAQENIRREIQQQAAQVAELEEAYRKAQEAQAAATDRAKTAGRGTTPGSKTYPKYLEEATQEAEKAKQAYESAQAALEALKASYADSQDTIEAFALAVEQDGISVNLFGANTEKVAQALQTLRDPTKDNTNAFRVLKQVFEETGDGASALLAKLENLENHVNEHTSKVDTFTNSWERLKTTMADAQIAKSVSELLRGVTSTAMGINSLNSALKTYKSMQEGTTSAMDGWLSIITSVGFGLPMVISGVGKLGDSFKVLTGWVMGNLPAIGAFVAEFGPMILAVGAAVAAVTLFYQAVTSQERALKNAQTQVDKSSKAYAEAKKAYEDLKQSITDYQDARAAIEDMTAGTEAWRDAITEANEQVLQLLTNYPELAKYVKQTSEGLVISQEGMDYLHSTSQQQVRDAQTTSIAAQMRLDVLNVKDQAELRDALETNFIQPLQDLIGRDIGPEYRDALINLFQEFSKEQKDAVQSYINSNDVNGLANYLESLYNADSENGVFAASKILTMDFELTAQDILAAGEALNEFDNNLRNTTDNYTSILRTRGQEIARIWIDSFSEATTKSISDRSVYQAALGNKIAATGGDIDKLQEVYQGVIPLIEQINQIIEVFGDTKLAQGVSNLFGGQANIDDFLDFSVSEFDQIISGLPVQGEDFIQSLGFETKEIMNEALSEVRELITINQDRIVGLLPEAIQQIFKNNLNLEDLSLDQTQNIGNVLQYYWKNLGLDALNDVIADLNSADSSQWIETLSGIGQFFKDGEVTDLTALTKYLQETTDNAAAQLEKLGLGANDLTPSLMSLAGSFTEAKKVADKLNFTDIIDDEDDISALMGVLGDQFDDFFATTAGGAKQLVKSGEELRQKIDEIQLEKLSNGIEQIKQEQEQLDQILKIGSHPTSIQDQARLLTALRERGLAQGAAAEQGNIDTWLDTFSRTKMKAAVEENQAGFEALQGEYEALTKDAQDLEQAIKLLQLALDEDVDASKWEALTTYLRDMTEQFKDDQMNAALASEAILRFAAAAEQVGENYADWEKALTDSSSTLDKVEAVEELRNVYMDLLNIDDANALDWDFLTDSTNLELLQSAIEGDEDAFNQLAASAGEAYEPIENLYQLLLEILGLGSGNNSAKIFESYRNAASITNGLSYGKSISDQQYNDLIKFNQDFEKFFTIGADGLHTFNGDIEELSEAVNSTHIDNITKQLQELEEQMGDQKVLSNYFNNLHPEARKIINQTSTNDTASDQLKILNDLYNAGVDLEGFDNDWYAMFMANKRHNNYQGYDPEALETLGHILEANREKLLNYDESLEQLIDDYNKLLEAGHAAEKTLLDSDIDQQRMQTISKYLQENSAYYADRSRQADMDAAAMLRFADAIDTIKDKTDDWNESSKKGLDTQLQTVDEITETLADLYDVDEDAIDKNVASQKNVITLLQQVAQGNKEAYFQLAEALGLEVQSSWEMISAATDEFLKAANRIEEMYSKYGNASGIVGNLKEGSTISASQGEALSQYFSDNGWAFNLSDYFTQMADGTLMIGEKAQELKHFVDEVQLDALQKMIDQTNENAAGATQALSGLNDMLKQIGSDGVVSFEEQMQYLRQMAESGSLTDSSGMSIGVNELQSFDSNQIAELFNFASSQGLEDYRKQIQDTTEDIKAMEEAVENLQHKMREDQLDADIDSNAWENMADYIHENAAELEGLSADLEESRRASDNLAESILRFDDAIVDVTKNYDSWKDALEYGAMQDYVDIVDDLKDAYADLLDLDWDDFSDSFLQSAENLDLMKEAAEGSEEAYDQLMQAVQQDIEDQTINVRADLDASDFYAKKDALLAEMDALNFQELEIGANLDIGNFLSACEEMINAAGMTADQATAYLASMGIDADVQEHEEQMTETQELPNYTVTMTPVTGNYAIPYGDGSYFAGVAEGEVINQSQTYNPSIETLTTTKTVKTPTLEVKSANKSSGGGYKYNNASHGGGGSNPNRGKGGGGGGGGGQKPKKPMKPFKSKIDPYHDVNIKIGDVKEGLERLEKQRDKLIGKDAVKNLTEQINLMERQKELLQEKADIAKQEASRLQGELGALGAIFEKNGDIANYKQLLLDKQNQINNAISVANGLEGDYRDAYEDYISDLKDEYSELEDKISEYDETIQLLDDLDLEYRDIINKQIELAIEAFNVEIEVKLNVKDAIKDFNDFRKRIIDGVKEDDYGGQAAAAMNNYGTYYYQDDQGNTRGLIGDLYEHTRQIVQESSIIMNGGFSNIYGDNLQAAADDLKKYNDELMEALEDVQDIVDEVHDNLLEAIDAMQDAFDTQQEAFDKLDNLLTHDMELLQLIHGEENFDEMNTLWQQQVQQDEKRLRALQEQQEYWHQKVKEYEKGTDEWKKAMENWQSAFESTNEAMIDAVKNLQSQWENSINGIMNQLRNQTFGGNMNAALEDWDKMVWHSDKYLDSIERASGLLELQTKYRDAINNTTDTTAQEKLAKLEEQQLDTLANKEHLREVDLKVAEQQLAVIQAQLALEDAQQAKTKLRLRRDSQGNYNYQYVADDDVIEEKTNEYIRALNDYRALTQDTLRSDLEAIRDYTLDYYDALEEAQMAYGDNTEALMAEEERLYQMYFGEDGYITNLHTDAISSMSDAQEAMFINLYGLNQVLEEDLFKKFLGPDSDMVTAVEGLLAAGGTIPSILDAFIDGSAQTAFNNIETMSRGAFDEMTINAYDAFGVVGDEAIALADLVLDCIKGPEGMLPEWQSALWQIVETYNTEFVPRIIDAVNELQYANQAYVDGLAIVQTAAKRTTEQIALGLWADAEYTNALTSTTNELIAAQKAEVEACEAVYNALMKNQAMFKAHSIAATEAANANFLYWVSMQGGVSTGVPYSIDGISGDFSSTVPSIVYPQAASVPAYTDSGGGGGGGGYCL